MIPVYIYRPGMQGAVSSCQKGLDCIYGKAEIPWLLMAASSAAVIVVFTAMAYVGIRYLAEKAAPRPGGG